MSVHEVTSRNFDVEVLQSSMPVIVDFYSTQCPPCRALAPHLDQLAEEFAGCVKIVKVNVDHDPSLAIQSHVSAVPTLVWFDEGQETHRTLGANPATLRQMLTTLCIA